MVEGDRLAGCITPRQVKETPLDRWAVTAVGELARDCSDADTIRPDTVDALAQMHPTATARLMAVEDNRLAGIMALKDLLQSLSVKIELEEP